MNIRPAKAEDWCHGLWKCLNSLSPITAITTGQFDHTLKKMRKQDKTIYVLTEADGPVVVSTASLLIEVKVGKLAAHIEDVATHPDFRRKGYATRLLNYLIAEAALRHCYKVILNCTEANASFYERVGFRRHENGMRLDLNQRTETTTWTQPLSSSPT